MLSCMFQIITFSCPINRRSLLLNWVNDFSRKQEEEEGAVKGFDGPGLNAIGCKHLMFI